MFQLQHQFNNIVETTQLTNDQCCTLYVLRFAAVLTALKNFFDKSGTAHQHCSGMNAVCKLMTTGLQSLPGTKFCSWEIFWYRPTTFAQFTSATESAVNILLEQTRKKNRKINRRWQPKWMSCFTSDVWFQ